jgi:signal transduction histidine kinase/ActR/RegA family two-component response regulator
MTSLLSCVAELADPARRSEAGKALAERLGGEDLVIFSMDEEVTALLPAPGFPQTLPHGRAWRAFVRECGEEGRAESTLCYPDEETRTDAAGFALREGAVLVLLGGRPQLEAVAEVAEVLPLLVAAFRAERKAMAGAEHAAAATASAQKTQELVARLTQVQVELQDALRELREASRLKDEFLATLSHELRTPLNAIVGWAHVLRDGGLDRDMVEKALETITRSAHMQNQLISDMLDVSRIVAGKLRIEVGQMDLVAVIHAAIDTVRPSARAKGIRLETLLEPGAGPMVGDPDRLQQVVWNLLSNAIKFTPSGGEVRIHVGSSESDIAITVEDDGPGIDPAFLPHVFDRFRQADSSPSRTHAGLGLGLAIVRHLVELHGGTVQARNREGAQGAAFDVRLPRPSASPSEATPEPLAGASPHGGGPFLAGVMVLVVDDQPDAREVVATILERAGAEVITAPSAAEGLAILKRERPDALVADIEMPNEDGYSLIQSVRALPPDQGGLTPAAALTAYAGARDRARALAAGFEVHVAKPVHPADLVNVVARLTSRRADRT